MKTPAEVIVTAPLVDVVALYVSVSPKLASVARTVPVTAPVMAFGSLTGTLEMTGAEFEATNFTVAVGKASWLVETETAGATAVFDAAVWRRATARTAQDSGDSVGTPVPEPSNGDGTAVNAAGTGTIAGAAAAGVTATGVVTSCVATGTVAAIRGATVPS